MRIQRPRITMRYLCILSGALLIAGCSSAARARLPPPAFELVNGLPAFVVECHNTSGKPVNFSTQPTALRLDGKIIDMRQSVGSFLGGLPADIEPGQAWTTRIVLHPRGEERSGDISSGSLITSHQPVDLQLGEHSLAVECVGNWSASTSFEWRGR